MAWDDTRTFPSHAGRRNPGGKHRPAVAHSSAPRPAVRRGGGPTWLARRWRCDWVSAGSLFPEKVLWYSFPSWLLGLHTSYLRNCYMSIFLMSPKESGSMYSSSLNNASFVQCRFVLTLMRGKISYWPRPLSVWSSYVLSMSAWVFSGNPVSFHIPETGVLG